MQKLLHDLQGGFCPICKKVIPISNAVIHHINYKQLCRYSNTNKLLKPTKSNPGRKITIANPFTNPIITEDGTI